MPFRSILSDASLRHRHPPPLGHCPAGARSPTRPRASALLLALGLFVAGGLSAESTVEKSVQAEISQQASATSEASASREASRSPAAKPAPRSPDAPSAPRPTRDDWALQPGKPLKDDAGPAVERRWMRNRKNGPLGVRMMLPEGFEHSDILMKRGNDERWARPNWDDRDWEVVTENGLPARTGIFWIRYRIRGPGRLPGGITQKVGAAFELYWDGKLVGRSGEPADEADGEEPGKLDTTFSIPAEWLVPDGKPRKPAKGAKPVEPVREYVVAMRMSNHLYGFPGERTDLQVYFTTPDGFMAENQRTAIETAIAAGGMSMVALAGLTLWLVALRRPVLLLFTGLCACAAITQFMTMARSLGSYDYDWHYPFRLGMVYLAGVLGACLIAFVGMHFKVPRLRWLLGVHLGLMILILMWPRELHHVPLSERSGMVMLVAFLISAAAAGWAAWRQERGALMVLAGCLMSAFVGGRFIEGRFFPAFLPTMIGLLGAVALRLRAEARAAQETRLAATRLELELLKKNLQPHFLLNSLTALAEVVERDPTVAGKLIGDLAGVFRALGRMSGEKQVSVAQELDLCRAHLRVMSIRTGVEWRLETHNVVPDHAVPPALFLTLIENGYIHQRVRGGAGIFELTAEPREGGTTYTFVSPGEIKVQPDRADGGTGLRYVKARLEESFPGRWSFAHGPHPAGGWATVIELWRRGHAT